MYKYTEKDILQCELCKKTVLRKSPVQKYCEKCSQIKDIERKTNWAKKHAKSVAKTQKKHSGELRPYLLKARKERSVKETALTWTTDEKFKNNFDLHFSFKIPFDQNLSKNALWRTGKFGHTYLRKEARELKETIGEIIKNSKVKWRTNKVYIKILVQKPDMRGDAINFIDTICDGIKLGLHLDDNWFSLAGVDWEICKDSPHVAIGLYQENKDVMYCSNCGLPQDFSNFNKSKHNKYGVYQPCKNCTKLAREIRNKEKILSI